MDIYYRRLDTFVVTLESGRKYIRLTGKIWTDGKKILDEKQARGLEEEFIKHLKRDYKNIILKMTEIREFEE